jgi:hypothetical protein
VFQLAELSVVQVFAALALGFVPVSVVESTKIVRRLWARRHAGSREAPGPA